MTDEKVYQQIRISSPSGEDSIEGVYVFTDGVEIYVVSVAGDTTISWELTPEQANTMAEVMKHAAAKAYEEATKKLLSKEELPCQ